MKKNYFLALLAIFLLIGGLSFFSRLKNEEDGRDILAGEKSELAEIFISGKKVRVEIAKTEKQREQGLSGRQNLCADCGMLFIFSGKGVYPFWMKDMFFNLDIIWVADDTIVAINKNVSYQRGSREIVRPPVTADKVLEINAGKSLEWGLEEGDRIEF